MVDEFAIILSPLSEKKEAIDIANCIYQTLQLPFKLDGREVYVTPSIGIAFSAIGYDRPEDFLQAADTAMQTCKRIKQAPYAVFEPEWHVGAMQSLQLETDLRQAIQRRDLRVYYQPIDLQSIDRSFVTNLGVDSESFRTKAPVTLKSTCRVRQTFVLQRLSRVEGSDAPYHSCQGL